MPSEDPASRFVRAAEQWLNHNVVGKVRIRVPSMTVFGARHVKLEAMQFPPQFVKIAQAIMGHLGKLADLLQVTLEIEADDTWYTSFGYRAGPDRTMVRPPTLHETMEPFSPIRRWWVNTMTGDMIDVPTDNHLDYLLGHQKQFGIEAAYRRSEAVKLVQDVVRNGWQPASYAGGRLILRFASGTQKALRYVLQQVRDQLPLETVTVIDNDGSRDIAGDGLLHFSMNGHLPRPGRRPHSSHRPRT